MSDPGLNPFIERYPSPLERRASVAAATPSGALPSLTAVNSDLALGGPREPPGTLLVQRYPDMHGPFSLLAGHRGVLPALSLDAPTLLAESKQLQEAKAGVVSMPDDMLVELRALYHTEETPMFISRTLGAVSVNKPRGCGATFRLSTFRTACFRSELYGFVTCGGIVTTADLCGVWRKAVLGCGHASHPSGLFLDSGVLAEPPCLDPRGLGHPGKAHGWCYRHVRV